MTASSGGIYRYVISQCSLRACRKILLISRNDCLTSLHQLCSFCCPFLWIWLMKKLLVFPSEIQHSLVLIDLLYFGSNCLLISFIFYIYNDINHIILLQVFYFFIYLSVLSDAFGATDFNVLMSSGWVDHLAVCCFFHCFGEAKTSFPILNSEIFSSNSFFSSLFTFNSLISTVLILMRIIKWELIVFFLEYYLVLMFVQNPSKIVMWTKTRAFSYFSVLIFPLRKWGGCVIPMQGEEPGRGSGSLSEA